MNIPWLAKGPTFLQTENEDSDQALWVRIRIRIYVLSCLFIAALWSLSGKGLTSRLSCMRCCIVFCHFPMWCPGSGVLLDCIDS